MRRLTSNALASADFVVTARRVRVVGVALSVVALMGLTHRSEAQASSRGGARATNGSGSDVMQKIERRFAATPTISVRLSGSVGTVRLIGWDKDSVVIVGSIPKGMRFESGIGGDGHSPAPGAKMYLEST
ncbi:MAG: hypothetical protein ABIT38_08780, partial [Gemmatimonadaceae bacterium]